MNTITDFIKNHGLENKSELIFFGGSFNPWHAGHSECLRLMRKKDSIIVVPDHSPHKKMTLDNEKSSSLDEMKKEIKKVSNSILIFEEFWRRNEINPTINWIEKIHESFPKIKLSLLIGFDTYRTITTWNDADTLLKILSSLYVVSRLEDEEERLIYKDKILFFNHEIKLDFLGRHPFEHLSSTSLREIG